MIAMQLGKSVYCEKPVCHDVAEARAMRAMAAKSKVATQMGNQGHCEDGYRKLCEYIWAGVIGKVTETHSWTNRANGGMGANNIPRKIMGCAIAMSGVAARLLIGATRLTRPNVHATIGPEAIVAIVVPSRVSEIQRGIIGQR